MTGLTKRRRLAWMLMAAWVILFPAMLNSPWGQPQELREVSGPRSRGEPVPLLGEDSIGFTFIAPQDNLAGIEAAVVTYGRINPIKVIMLLFEMDARAGFEPDPALRAPLRRSVVDARRAKDWSTLRFKFRPVKKSAGRRFHAVFFSPAANVSRCLGFLTAKSHQNEDWVGFRGGRPWDRTPAAGLLVAEEGQGWSQGWWWLILVGIVVLGLFPGFGGRK